MYITNCRELLTLKKKINIHGRHIEPKHLHHNYERTAICGLIKNLDASLNASLHAQLPTSIEVLLSAIFPICCLSTFHSFVLPNSGDMWRTTYASETEEYRLIGATSCSLQVDIE
jgi:hypothetical protein